MLSDFDLSAFRGKKAAITHDWLTNMGGAERCVEAFHSIFPDAPIFTTMADLSNLDEAFSKMEIRTSFLQKKVKKGHQKTLPFMPFAFENFDMSPYDIVLSSSSCCSKGVITRSDAVHFCYCHTPIRYAWEFYAEYMRDAGFKGIKNAVVRAFMSVLRVWDKCAADRVDFFIANSKTVQRRIKKYYGRESVVINPPIRCGFFTPTGERREDFFLVVSRLVPYKRVDLAVEAFSKLKVPLFVVGDGSEKERLQSLAADNIRFLGRLDDEDERGLMRRARALVFPGEEDFGMTPVEAMACGCPVVAYGKGGAAETVRDGETGALFEEQSAECLAAAVEKFCLQKFDGKRISEWAQGFDEKIFCKKIARFIAEKI